MNSEREQSGIIRGQFCGARPVGPIFRVPFGEKLARKDRFLGNGIRGRIEFDDAEHLPRGLDVLRRGKPLVVAGASGAARGVGLLAHGEAPLRSEE